MQAVRESVACEVAAARRSMVSYIGSGSQQPHSFGGASSSSVWSADERESHGSESWGRSERLPSSLAASTSSNARGSTQEAPHTQMPPRDQLQGVGMAPRNGPAALDRCSCSTSEGQGEAPSAYFSAPMLAAGAAASTTVATVATAAAVATEVTQTMIANAPPSPLPSPPVSPPAASAPAGASAGTIADCLQLTQRRSSGIGRFDAFDPEDSDGEDGEPASGSVVDGGSAPQLAQRYRASQAHTLSVAHVGGGRFSLAGGLRNSLAVLSERLSRGSAARHSAAPVEAQVAEVTVEVAGEVACEEAKSAEEEGAAKAEDASLSRGVSSLSEPSGLAVDMPDGATALVAPACKSDNVSPAIARARAAKHDGGRGGDQVEIRHKQQKSDLHQTIQIDEQREVARRGFVRNRRISLWLPEGVLHRVQGDWALIVEEGREQTQGAVQGAAVQGTARLLVIPVHSLGVSTLSQLPRCLCSLCRCACSCHLALVQVNIDPSDIPRGMRAKLTGEKLRGGGPLSIAAKRSQALSGGGRSVLKLFAWLFNLLVLVYGATFLLYAYLVVLEESPTDWINAVLGSFALSCITGFMISDVIVAATVACLPFQAKKTRTPLQLMCGYLAGLCRGACDIDDGL